MAQILNSVAEEMRAEFHKNANIAHRGEKGTAREIVAVRQFFDQYLPGHVQAVHNGEIITANGDVSPQCDVIIHDPTMPPMLTTQSYRILPNECVYGVVEVKSNLDRKELFDACDKIRAAKVLPKTAFDPDLSGKTRTVYGQVFGYVPTVGIVFGYDSIDLLTLKGHLKEWSEGRPAAELPDSVWVLDKGYLQWLTPENSRIDPSPSPGSTLGAFKAPTIGNVLFPLMFHLHVQFGRAWMPPVRLLDYAGNAPIGTFLGGDTEVT
ncbi:MAG: hypothetical protein QOI89_3649 [Solirubrobacteraceae bacterium]|nr:hypothetical protein [Solirubrobacteraceae bacterium]